MDVTLVTTWLLSVVVPVFPVEKESNTPELVAEAGAVSVIWDTESTDLIVVPAGIPGPVTTMPPARVLVEGRLVTTALVIVVFPVMAVVAVALADRVSVLVAESMAKIVAAAGMPGPATD